MKILIIAGMYPKPQDDSNGDFIHRQVMELSNLGMEARVICPISRIRKGFPFIAGMQEGGAKAQTKTRDNICITYLPYWNFPLGISPRIETLLRYFRLLQLFKGDLAIDNFDLLHTYHLFPTGYSGWLLARKLGIPSVSTAVGSDVHTHPHRSRAIAKLTRETITHTDQIIARSHELAGQIENLAHPSKPVKVVYNGVDTLTFEPHGEPHVLRSRLGLPQEGIGFCTAGRLVEGKGLRELVTAFGLIHSHHPLSWLVIVGDGPLKSELKERVRENKLEGRVFLIGPRPHNEVADWMSAADIFILASYAEGLPNVVLEAMACGRPVIATNVGGIPEAAIDGETALLAPPRQVPPLVEAMDALIQDAGLRRRMGVAGRERIEAHFTWPQSARQLAEIYTETVHRAEAAR
jgi:glycosyltransferase involved in cell wall biosynthesis